MSVEIQSTCRDAWFNCVVHGFSRGSDLARKYDTELRVIAKNSPPLIADTRTTLLESDIVLNTILQRGKNVPNTVEHKRRLIALLPGHEKDIASLTYPLVIFLETALLLESLRASCGDCFEVLSYFVDPILKIGETANCMNTIAHEASSILYTTLNYILTIQRSQIFTYRKLDLAYTGSSQHPRLGSNLSKSLQSAVTEWKRYTWWLSPVRTK